MHTKNQANSSIHSRDIANLRILQPDYPRVFLPISQVLEFLQVQNFHREEANDEGFRFTPKPGKTNDKMFQNLQKTLFQGHFGDIFPIFGPLIFFFKNQALSRTTSYYSLHTSRFSKKSNDRISRKHSNRQTDRWTNGRTDERARVILQDPIGHWPGVQLCNGHN